MASLTYLVSIFDVGKHARLRAWLRRLRQWLLAAEWATVKGINARVCPDSNTLTCQTTRWWGIYLFRAERGTYFSLQLLPTSCHGHQSATTAVWLSFAAEITAESLPSIPPMDHLIQLLPQATDPSPSIFLTFHNPAMFTAVLVPKFNFRLTKW